MITARWALSLVVAMFVSGSLQGAGVAIDPPYYVKGANWQATMLDSLDAIARQGLAEGFTPFESETLCGGQPAQRISLPVAGDTMYLFVTGCPDVKWGVADWVEPRLVRKDGRTRSLTNADSFKALLGRHEIDLTLRSGLYQKLRLGTNQFETGLNVQANSVLMVPIEKDEDRFQAIIGVDAWAGTNGTVRFSVLGPRAAARKRLWELLARDFPDGPARQQMNWEREDRIYEREWPPGDFTALASAYAKACWRVPPVSVQALKRCAQIDNNAGLNSIRELYYRSRMLDAALSGIRTFDFEALRLAIDDLSLSEKYPKTYRIRLAGLQKSVASGLTKFRSTSLADYERVAKWHDELEMLKREALLANPLLDFDKLLFIKRKPIGEARRSQWEGFGLGEYLGVPRQSSWANGTMPNVDKWTNEMAVLSPVRPEGRLTTVFKPAENRLITDVDLHFNARKLLFSMPDKSKHWQIYELPLSDAGVSPAKELARDNSVAGEKLAPLDLRQLTPTGQPDVHNYDSCYLPNGKILFLSTAVMQGVPCNAGVIVGMMYQMDGDGKDIHQVCFEQDHDYNPSVLNDGRVLYLRWDYTDTPHVWNRVLMSMNPDGTDQAAYYGANSYWPNSVFYSRAIPQHATKIVGIVTGHHEGRLGELVVFDPTKGTQETDGVVQRIPGRGRKVEPRIEDKLTEHSWPKFTHPWPLSEKYFIVACKPQPDSLWGVYLVDVFDNMTLLKEEEGWALLEPIPLRPRVAPPIIPDKVHPERKDALAYMDDVYSGPGLKDVPRGTIKSLRLFTYHFGYQTLAGIDNRVGSDGPWETKRVLGTVPVEADGSAWFRIPAKTPISVQPLDAEGKAVALMRSWMTAMPGENLSCVGCHQRSSAAPPVKQTLAFGHPPSEIKPWRGPVRGFSFAREVQPVLDRFCVDCHNGQPAKDGKSFPDLRRDQGAYVVYDHGKIDGKIIRGVPKNELLGRYSAVFDPSYVVLRQFVRVGGLESDLHPLPPKEFHADTSELIQMLQKGHHNVRLDAEAWDRLVTWIDLNAPCHGAWGEVTRLPGNQRQRRLALRELYGGIADDCEELPELTLTPATPLLPEELPQKKLEVVTAPQWPFTGEAARQRQMALGPITRTVDLGGGLKMEFVRIPVGTFVMGDADGDLDERPCAAVRIEQPFWMAKDEVSNEQFAQFDSSHDSRFEHRSSWIFSEEYLGWPLNRPKQPVVRVSWNEALAFCRWLSAKLGEEVTLPTEAQWEYACRAGTDTPLFFGNLDADFSRFANLGDASLRKLADEGWRPKAPDLVPREDRFNDGALVTIEAGHYQPNAWGLHDMHGNAAEWCRTTYRPYPYHSDDGRNDLSLEGNKVVRGGSWRDRPKLCRSASRLSYPAYQKVFNVGFRVIIEPGAKSVATAAK